MDNVINMIIKKNYNIFDDNPIVKKINVGFTNTIFVVNDKYIIKICSNFDNEINFEKEVNFYNMNSDNDLIPKIYYSDISKEIVPYYYEIIEKIEGVSLYNIWHKLNENERKNIIQQLCDAMKKFHNVSGNPYDWPRYIKEKFDEIYDEAKLKKVFSNLEQELIDSAYKKFDKYLTSNEFCLIHNDLHFDNVFYNNGKIKLIDFERSMIAPIDYELDILYRMVRMPWKFAGDDTEDFTKIEDYENIMSYVSDFYPKLVCNKYLYQRLAIYDMLYFLKQFVKHPEFDDLKEPIINGAKLIVDCEENNCE